MRQVVSVSVLGGAGETQTAETSFPLSEEGMQLTLEQAPGLFVKDSLPAIKAMVRTAAGMPWKDSVAVTCDIYHAPEGLPRQKVVSGINLPANRAVRISELSALPSGNYEFVMRATAEKDTAELTWPFELFSMGDRRPADGMKSFFYCVNDTVAPGRPGWLKVGSAADSVSLYYMLFSKERILEEKLYHFSDSILDFTYPALPQDADGLQAVFYFVKDGESHEERFFSSLYKSYGEKVKGFPNDGDDNLGHVEIELSKKLFQDSVQVEVSAVLLQIDSIYNAAVLSADNAKFSRLRKTYSIPLKDDVRIFSIIPLPDELWLFTDQADVAEVVWTIILVLLMVAVVVLAVAKIIKQKSIYRPENNKITVKLVD